MRTYYSVVRYGPFRSPDRVFDTRQEAEKHRQRKAHEDPFGWNLKETRVHGYRSKAEALTGDLSYSIGEGGRVE